ncbi:MAG: bifunctional lytic transglycosylase/C40 family peptidase [Dehalococcoidia bacterium]|nr:bifunctional lytic transglycosylase/C40 family peptidase [Dehalococcoidia bacterium]
MNPTPGGDILGNVPNEGLKVVGIVGALFIMPMLFLMAAVGGTPGIAQSPASAAAVAEIPPEHLVVIQQVGAATGVPWQVLAAIANVESGFGVNMGPSSAGALGYCQFMPATWAHYGVDGDGDGIADPFNLHDCLPAAAQYLLDSGAPGDLRRALYAYNHSGEYVDYVLAIAGSYGYLDPRGIPAQAVALARSRLGLPYVWGAAGPDTFDCSGLTQWIYAQFGISLPRTAQAQFEATTPVLLEYLQPGDLMFYEQTYVSHERITHVGIYVGNGIVIMATQPGEFVKEVPLDNSYWARYFVSAGRPVKGPTA